MSDKIKECCENCKYYTGKQCDTNGNWNDECSLYSIFCSQPCSDFEIAKGGGLKKRIAELEAENKKLKAENKILLDDLSKVQADCFKCEHGDVRKLVKPLQWEHSDEDEIFKESWNNDIFAIYKSDTDGNFELFLCPHHFLDNYQTLDKAKQYAQDWLVSLVAKALESEVTK